MSERLKYTEEAVMEEPTSSPKRRKLTEDHVAATAPHAFQGGFLDILSAAALDHRQHHATTMAAPPIAAPGDAEHNPALDSEPNATNDRALDSEPSEEEVPYASAGDQDALAEMDTEDEEENDEDGEEEDEEEEDEDRDIGDDVDLSAMENDDEDVDNPTDITIENGEEPEMCFGAGLDDVGASSLPALNPGETQDEESSSNDIEITISTNSFVPFDGSSPDFEHCHYDLTRSDPSNFTQLPLNWTNSARTLQAPADPISPLLSPFQRRGLDPNETRIPLAREDDKTEITVPLTHVRGTRALIPAEEEVCLLCGSTGCVDWQIFCHDCGDCFHTFCLNPPVSRDKLKPSANHWRCPQCKFCEACRGTDREEELLVCDNCDRCYHLFCMQPPLSELPTGAWRCVDCLQCLKCGDPLVSPSQTPLCGVCQSLYSTAVNLVLDHISGPNTPLLFPRVRLSMNLPKKAAPTAPRRNSVDGPTGSVLHETPTPKVPQATNAVPPNPQLDFSEEKATLAKTGTYYHLKDAAFIILRKAGRPLNIPSISEIAIRERLIRTDGKKSSERTMATNVCVDVSKNGSSSRFKRVSRGLFTLSAVGLAAPTPEPIPPVSLFQPQPSLSTMSQPLNEDFARAVSESDPEIMLIPPLPGSTLLSLTGSQLSQHSFSQVRNAEAKDVGLSAEDAIEPAAVQSSSAHVQTEAQISFDDISVQYSPGIPSSSKMGEDASHKKIELENQENPPIPGVSDADEVDKHDRPVKVHIVASETDPSVPMLDPDVVMKDNHSKPFLDDRMELVEFLPSPAETQSPAPVHNTNDQLFREQAAKEWTANPILEVYRVLLPLVPFAPSLQVVLDRLPTISTASIPGLSFSSTSTISAPSQTDAPAELAFSPLSQAIAKIEPAEKVDPSSIPTEPTVSSSLAASTPSALDLPVAPSLDSAEPIIPQPNTITETNGELVTTAVVVATPSVVLAAPTPAKPVPVGKTRGRNRKDGLPKVPRLLLSYIATQCGMTAETFMLQIEQATKLRSLSARQPKLPSLASVVPAKGKKRTNDGNRVLLSASSGKSASHVPKKRKPKSKATFSSSPYGRDAFTMDYGLSSEYYARKSKKRSNSSHTTSNRRATAAFAAVVASEAKSALFISAEARKKHMKPKALPVPRPPKAEAGFVAALHELLAIQNSLESGPVVMSLFDLRFSPSSLTSSYEIELLRRSEQTAPQLEALMRRLPQFESQSAPLIFTPLSRDTLDDWDRQEPSASGRNRKCVLCSESGDNILRGRLILADTDTWVHVNCVSWSADVYESDLGDLLGVQKALERGKLTKCKVCNTTGATLVCKTLRCPNTYHFSCAIRANCKFSPKEHLLTCESHAVGKVVSHTPKKERMNVDAPTFSVPLWTMLPTRRVAIDPDTLRRKPNRSVLLGLDNRTRATLVASEPKFVPKLFQHRVGALTVHNLGRVVWEYPAFHTSSRIIPSDYFASRKFWTSSHGTNDAYSRTVYDMEIVASTAHQRPLYRISCRDHADPNSVIQAWSAEDAWASLLDRVNAVRKSVGLDDFVRMSLPADIFFGAACPTIIRQLEKLPNIRLLTRAPVEPYVPQHALSVRAPLQLVRAAVFTDNPDALQPLPENPSGCARTEPYTKLSARDKFAKCEQYGWHPATLLFRPSTVVGNFFAPSVSMRPSSDEFIREQDAIVVAQKYYRMKEKENIIMRVMRSRIHEWGVFAVEPIRAGDFMIEYVGELIRPVVADLREKYYDSKGIGCYMFRLDDLLIVDATKRGNMARFLNHCCEPNAATEVIEVHGKKHIVIYARRDIKIGEELVYDYNFNFEEDTHKIRCFCGARNCRGWMN